MTEITLPEKYRDLGFKLELIQSIDMDEKNGTAGFKGYLLTIPDGFSIDENLLKLFMSYDAYIGDIHTNSDNSLTLYIYIHDIPNLTLPREFDMNKLEAKFLFSSVGMNMYLYYHSSSFDIYKKLIEEINKEVKR